MAPSLCNGTAELVRDNGILNLFGREIIIQEEIVMCFNGGVAIAVIEYNY